MRSSPERHVETLGRLGRLYGDAIDHKISQGRMADTKRAATTWDTLTHSMAK